MTPTTVSVDRLPALTKSSSRQLVDQLCLWVQLARQYPPGNPMRDRHLTQIIRSVTPKLWRFPTPYYADALQQTWEYFAKNICTTYDPRRASVVTWLNTYLRYRHADLLRRATADRQRHIDLDALDYQQYGLHGRHFAQNHDSLSLLQAVVEWIHEDPTGELCCIHLVGHPEINCQALLLLRLPPEKPWKEISAEFGVSISTLASFYQRQCLPRLRQFGQDSDWCE